MRRSILTALLGLCLSSMLGAQTPPQLPDVVALHWLPQTAQTARAYSVIAAAWWAHSEREASDDAFWAQWQEAIEAGEIEPNGPQISHHLADGRWGHWVMSGGFEGQRPSEPLNPPWQAIRGWAHPADSPWQAVVARSAPAIWQAVGLSRMQEIYAPLWAEWNQASATERSHAQAQARRVIRMNQAQSPFIATKIQGSLLLAQARLEWSQQHFLESAWLILEGLMWLEVTPDSQNARFYADWLTSIPSDEIRALRAIDIELPLIVALLVDSALDLAGPDEQASGASQRLALAYARLALIVKDPMDYLDQPVRDQMRAIQEACLVADGSEVSPLTPECMQDITALLLERIDGDELVGARGPLSTEFLFRELSLVSWQRARYLDSYVTWLLDAPCQVPDGFNVLEWNLGVAWLTQTPVGSNAQPAWVDLSDQLTVHAADFDDQSRQWLKCLAELDGGRQDVIERLIEKQSDALQALSVAIREASDEFYAEVTHLGSTVSLDEPLPETTDYAPSSRVIVPCDGGMTCGARVELPVDEGLMTLVSPGYWLAEQLQLGKVAFCYDNVHWVDRQWRAARHNDSGVAHYSGRLSLELNAYFHQADGVDETIFKKRLTATERQDYFFGRANEENLDIDCPHGLGGQPIQSELQTSASGLVPERLTYFTSVPTPVAPYLLNQWASGEAWQKAWGDPTRVDTVAMGEDRLLRQQAEVQRLSLVDRRERQLATRLAISDFDDSSDPLTLAMQEVEALSRVLRQMLSLHYGHLIRHDDGLRASVSGEVGLLTRGAVREARDAGIGMEALPSMGQDRLDQLRQYWTQWPASIREQGLRPPELAWAEIQINAKTSADVESLTDP